MEESKDIKIVRSLTRTVDKLSSLELGQTSSRVKAQRRDDLHTHNLREREREREGERERNRE